MCIRRDIQEVKTATTVGADAVKNFECLEKLGGYEVGFGHVICQTKEPYLASRNVQAAPVWAIPPCIFEEPHPLFSKRPLPAFHGAFERVFSCGYMARDEKCA